jgi:hypothetical protein
MTDLSQHPLNAAARSRLEAEGQGRQPVAPDSILKLGMYALVACAAPGASDVGESPEFLRLANAGRPEVLANSLALLAAEWQPEEVLDASLPLLAEGLVSPLAPSVREPDQVPSRNPKF